MAWWLFLVAIGALVAYLMIAYVFRVFSNFWHHDIYDDADLTHERTRPPGIDKDALLIDIHVHTTASDGLMTARQAVLWHVAKGYDGMVVSDHNTTEMVAACEDAAREVAPDFLVIPGVEFTSMRVHLNLIGVREPMPVPGTFWCTKKKIREAIEHAHAAGGLVQFNHRDWYPYKVLKHLPREWWLQQGIDGWEVYNGFGFVDEEALDFIEKNKERRVMFSSAGTDVHDPATHRLAYTEVLAEERTLEGVMDALKNGRTRVHYFPDDSVMPRPEKGMVKKNPEKEAFIKKWFWLYWAGEAIMMGPRRNALVALVLLVVVGSILLSIFLPF